MKLQRVISQEKEKPLKFCDNVYFRHRECDRGQGMRVFIKGIRYQADELLEFLDDGVCGG